MRRGRGKIIHQPCPKCRGVGTERRSRTIKAAIPAGIDNGQTISCGGQGHAGRNGGPAGDLHITVTVRPHEIFRREGNSVFGEAPISFVQAALGAEMEIPTIDGKVQYSIPEGTQSGTVFRLRGKGIPNLNGKGRGDQFVTVYVETPRNLTAEQREALKNLAKPWARPITAKSVRDFREKAQKINGSAACEEGDGVCILQIITPIQPAATTGTIP